MGYPYPIKDWLNGNLYPEKHSDLSSFQWAWEFLRRNPKYQKHWDVFSSKPDSTPGIGLKNGKWKGMPHEDDLLSDYCGYIFPPNLANETFADYQRRNEYEEWKVMPYADYFCSEFRIVPGPEAPMEDTLKALDFDDSMSSIISETPPYEINLKFDDEIKRAKEVSSLVKYNVSLVFDLRKPIDKQLQEAKDMLMDRRELLNYAKEYNLFSVASQTRHKKGLFPHFVRVLDAVASGARESEIASILYPHEANAYPDEPVTKKIHKNIIRAKSYRDSIYWTIS